MKFHSLQLLLGGLAISSSSAASTRRQRCTYGDPCWPSESVWQSFNSSVSGCLIRTVPSAAVCHDARYDATLCAAARDNWANSFWRTNQTGAYTAIAWELGDEQCFIDSPREAPCQQGLVPHYSVAASGVEDIQAAVKFAQKHDLYLTVKNTGHDHLGRSSGKGSFSIWTHNLKGQTWHDSFTPASAPPGTRGIQAVTLRAGEQWWDVYHAAAARGVIVVGGSARTVGSAGGYLTGGGHSPFSHFYGLAVDNLLEVDLVDPKGNVKTVNQFTDPDHFYAVRGGGGNSWGVITSATYKTHPNPSHIQVGLAQFNSTDRAGMRTLLNAVFRALPQITDAGYVGYGQIAGDRTVGTTTFQAIFIQANGTNATFNEGFAPLSELATVAGITGNLLSFELPSWAAYINTFLSDPNIATNVMDASRLLPPDVLLNRSDDLVDLLSKYPAYGAGFNFIGKVNSDQRDKTAAHPAWKEGRAIFSIGVDWNDDAPEKEKRRKKQNLVQISKHLGRIVGKDGGTYANEANPFEPDWKDVFWGPKYDRLLSIKKRVDPTNLFVCNRCVGTDVVFQP